MSTIRLPNNWASSETVSPHDPDGITCCACPVCACRPINVSANVTKSMTKRGKRLRIVIICSPLNLPLCCFITFIVRKLFTPQDSNLVKHHLWMKLSANWIFQFEHIDSINQKDERF